MIEQIIKSILFAGGLACIVAYHAIMPVWLLWLVMLLSLWIGEWYFGKKQ